MQDGLAAMQVEIRGWKIHTHDAQSYTISGCSSTTDLTRDFGRPIDPSRVAVVICILMCMSEPRCCVAAVVEDIRGRERR
jgi:hypothetical protein